MLFDDGINVVEQLLIAGVRGANLQAVVIGNPLDIGIADGADGGYLNGSVADGADLAHRLGEISAGPGEIAHGIELGGEPDIWHEFLLVTIGRVTASPLQILCCGRVIAAPLSMIRCRRIGDVFRQ